MHVIAIIFALFFLFVTTVRANAIFHITEDRGGRIGSYFQKYEHLRSNGEIVMIDGLCASACTIVLGAVPRERICVTQRARLGFHAAWDFGHRGQAVRNDEATQILMDTYPPPIRSWIRKRGGLKSGMMFLRGRELAALYPACR